MGCSDTSWTKLSAVNTEMPMCSNEGQQQPIMVGTEQTITCSNGENVVCNAGTYGCIDDSPTLCGATKQPIMVGGSGSLPPAYLQVPNFESCLGSETGEDGSSEMWCMPAEMPDGCSDTSWTKLSAVNTEMPMCSNEGQQQPIMVGTEQTITCSNGENVVCNAGTYGCIDDSPTLCGATKQPIMVGGSGSLPPAYPQVPNFESCLGSKDVGSYRLRCLPRDMPGGCAGESWAAL